MRYSPQKRLVGRRSGFVLIYTIVIFAAICGFVSLAVDYGRVQLDKAELQLAADAAARFGAKGIYYGDEIPFAIAAAANNTVDGQPVLLQSSDVQIGVWNATTSTFTVTSNNPNAVKITAQMTAARGTAISTPFAALLGFSTCNIHATSIATYTYAQSATYNVPATGDPWLAGMPNGTTADFTQYGDVAPKNSPTQITVPNMTAGHPLEFNFYGDVNTGNGQVNATAGGLTWDSNVNWWAQDNGNTEHGMSNLNAPIGSVIGVFLDNNEPDTEGTPPAALDFSTAASRNQTSISPQLRQPFYIGTGLTTGGAEQQFIVPTGATRFYMAVMDFQQWSDNAGWYVSTTTTPAQITLVQ